MITYPVNEIFNSIQGEGVWQGRAATFVRFAGCNLNCPWCDTAYARDTERAEKLTAEELSARILEISDNIDYIVLTGGEPGLQPLAPLVWYLHRAGKEVAVETNGTQWGIVGAGIDWVTLSPKLRQAEPLLAIYQIASEIKFPIKDREDVERASEYLITSAKLLDRDSFGPIICLQPVSRGLDATKICYEEVIKRGWMLSIQLHKYLVVR